MYSNHTITNVLIFRSMGTLMTFGLAMASVQRDYPAAITGFILLISL